MMDAVWRRLPAVVPFTSPSLQWYNPRCAFACYRVVQGAMLACSTHDDAGGHGHGGGATTAECRAGDLPFLTTVAYCTV